MEISPSGQGAGEKEDPSVAWNLPYAVYAAASSSTGIRRFPPRVERRLGGLMRPRSLELIVI